VWEVLVGFCCDSKERCGLDSKEVAGFSDLVGTSSSNDFSETSSLKISFSILERRSSFG